MSCFSNQRRILCVAALAAATLTIAAPASAQGLFERIFGGLARAVSAPIERAPQIIHSFADPMSGIGAPTNMPAQAERGPAAAYCVRTCDGHFFPVQAHAGLSTADACRAFCPASKTKLYSGPGIANAVASDGSRYSDLDTAFAYRQHLVAGCTCNGRDAFGLAHIDVATDPTLRPGDVVATKTGLAAVTGMENRTAQFTPIQDYRGVSKATRDKLAATKIMPPNPGAPNVEPVKLPLAAARQDNRSADLRR